MRKMRKKGQWFAITAVAVVVALVVLVVTGAVGIGGFKLFSAAGDTTNDIGLGTGTAGCSGSDPSYSYSAIDRYSNLVITGTTNIRLNGNKPVSSLANPTVGESLEYWVDNSTTFCEVAEVDTVKCGTQSLQTECYKNVTSISIKVRDLDNAIFLGEGGATTSTTGNVTLGANGVSNLDLRYQGTAKESGMPFGGCVAVEVPNTVTSTSLTGLGLSSGCPYQWTYTVSSTSNTYKLFSVPSGWDKDGAGDLKIASLQLKAGSSDPSGTGYVTFAPADYYVVSESGEIVLGIEEDKNDATTKTKGTVGQFSFIIE